VHCISIHRGAAQGGDLDKDMPGGGQAKKRAKLSRRFEILELIFLIITNKFRVAFRAES